MSHVVQWKDDQPVSVIIPVYNSIKYVGSCLQSLFDQTYRNIEIIAVDDGSTDGCGDLLDELAKNHSALKVIHKENGGVVSARHEGMRHATGEFLMFMDNDDEAEPEYVETMLEAIRKADADMVICGYRRLTGDGRQVGEMKLGGESWNKFRMVSPWGRIIRKSFVDANSLRFGNFLIGEDSFFALSAYEASDKIVTIPYQGYHWMYREESVSNTKQAETQESPIPMMSTWMKQHPIRKHITREELEYFVIKFLCWHFIHLSGHADIRSLLSVYRKERRWLKKNFPNYKKNKMAVPLKPRDEVFAIRLLVTAYVHLPEWVMGIGIMGFSLSKGMMQKCFVSES